jgi:hypothetical protein
MTPAPPPTVVGGASKMPPKTRLSKRNRTDGQGNIFVQGHAHDTNPRIETGRALAIL